MWGSVNFLVLCFLFSSAFSQGVFDSQRLTLKAGVVGSYSLTVPLLGSLASFSYTNPLKMNSTLQVCAKRSVLFPQNPASWNSNSCDFYLTFNTSQSNFNGFDLTPGSYTLGIVAAQAFNGTSQWSGLSCKTDTFGPNCTSTRVLTLGNNETFQFTSIDDQQFARIRVVNGTFNPSSGKQIFVVTGTSAPSFKVRVQYSFGNVLFGQAGSGTTRGNETVNLGVADSSDYYYLAVQPVANNSRRSARRLAADLQLTLTFAESFQFCANQSLYGPTCSAVNTINASNTQLISAVNSTAGVFTYYDVSGAAAWNVSVQSTDGSASPALYIKLGQVPDSGNYDAMKVNQTVNGFVVSSPGTWFVGVLGTGKQYSIWFNAQCPNGCSGNGQCVQTFDASAYQCNCSDGYSLYDCSSKNDTGFKTEYIVLIVIGSIIALAALLGLVVYLYNRGRNPGDGYERI